MEFPGDQNLADLQSLKIRSTRTYYDTLFWVRLILKHLLEVSEPRREPCLSSLEDEQPRGERNGLEHGEKQAEILQTALGLLGQF